MKPARFHPEALEEYDQGLAYYAGKVDDDLAAQFRGAVETVRDRARETPKLYAEDEETGCREALVRGFPYSLHCPELDDYIWVVAVAHHRRRPRYWVNRLRRK